MGISWNEADAAAQDAVAAQFGERVRIKPRIAGEYTASKADLSRPAVTGIGVVSSAVAITDIRGSVQGGQQTGGTRIAAAPMEHHIDGKDIMGATRRLELVIETAVASRVEIDGEPAVFIPHTDAGMEAVLGFMGRQVMRALLAGPAPWSELWRQVVTKIERLTVRRGASAEKGIRFAARQMILTCDTLAEPYFGKRVEACGFWARLLAAMGADAELLELARVLRYEIETPDITGQAAAAAALGVILGVAGGLGLGSSIPWGNISNPTDVAGSISGGQLGFYGSLDSAEALTESVALQSCC